MGRIDHQHPTPWGMHCEGSLLFDHPTSRPGPFRTGGNSLPPLLIPVSPRHPSAMPSHAPPFDDIL
eukprot:753744-Hanusia_phi.AAC.1